MIREGERGGWRTDGGGREHKLRQREANLMVREGEKWWTDKDIDEKKEGERDLLMFTLGNQYPSPLLLQRALVSVALMSTPHGCGAMQNSIRACHNNHLLQPTVYTKEMFHFPWALRNRTLIVSEKRFPNIYQEKSLFLESALQWFVSYIHWMYSTFNIENSLKRFDSTQSIITWRRMHALSHTLYFLYHKCRFWREHIYKTN